MRSSASVTTARTVPSGASMKEPTRRRGFPPVPAAGTVAHPGPWVTTGAAGTHNRDGKGSATLGNGSTYNGASVADANTSGGTSISTGRVRPSSIVAKARRTAPGRSSIPPISTAPWWEAQA